MPSSQSYWDKLATAYCMLSTVPALQWMFTYIGYYRYCCYAICRHPFGHMTSRKAWVEVLLFIFKGDQCFGLCFKEGYRPSWWGGWDRATLLRCWMWNCVQMKMKHHSITGPVEVQRSGLGYGIVVQCLFRGLRMGWRFGEGIKEEVRPGWRPCSGEENRVSWMDSSGMKDNALKPIGEDFFLIVLAMGRIDQSSLLTC